MNYHYTITFAPRDGPEILKRQCLTEFDYQNLHRADFCEIIEWILFLSAMVQKFAKVYSLLNWFCKTRWSWLLRNGRINHYCTPQGFCAGEQTLARIEKLATVCCNSLLTTELTRNSLLTVTHPRNSQLQHSAHYDSCNSQLQQSAHYWIDAQQSAHYSVVSRLLQVVSRLLRTITVKSVISRLLQVNSVVSRLL